MLTVAPLFIEPGSPWGKGYVESFNRTLRDELLNGELFDTWHEAHVRVERWRQRDNAHRPHSALEYRTPAPGTRTVAPMSCLSALGCSRKCLSIQTESPQRCIPARQKSCSVVTFPVRSVI